MNQASLPFLTPTAEGVQVELRVQPRAAKQRVLGLYGSQLRISISAPPVSGKANLAVEAMLARLLGVPRSQVEVVGGHKSRSKRVTVAGVDHETARRLLADQLPLPESDG